MGPSSEGAASLLKRASARTQAHLAAAAGSKGCWWRKRDLFFSPPFTFVTAFGPASRKSERKTVPVKAGSLCCFRRKITGEKDQPPMHNCGPAGGLTSLAGPAGPWTPPGD